MGHKLTGRQEEYPRKVFPDRPTIGTYLPAKTREFFTGGNRLLGNIPYYDLEAYRNMLKGTLTQHHTIRKDSSVNRVMACLWHILAKAVEWGMLERNSFDKGRSLQIKENNQRFRYLSAEEINRLLAAP